MTLPKTDGGPAFPVSVQPDFQYAEPGMSLRDWFAGLAMQARLSGLDMPRLDIRHAIATDAYAIADAMLAERSKP